MQLVCFVFAYNNTGRPKKSVPFPVSFTDKGTLFLRHPVAHTRKLHITNINTNLQNSIGLIINIRYDFKE